MAYMNQEMKKKISEKVKPILAKYKIKGTLSVRNHSTIVLTLKSGKAGKVDFVDSINRTVGNNPYYRNFRKVEDGHVQVNQYYIKDHFDGDAKECLEELYEAMKAANWFDKSDIMTDYFHTAYYIDINVGKWDTPYVVE